MCGICGIFNREDEGLVRKMANALQHRGPDDEGYFLDDGISLGVRRLSVIDLEKGHQPVFNEEGNICVIHNGEIYNFKELGVYLSEKGHKFKTQSDTEVIIHAYEEFGEDCVKYLDGMFAFAIWDSDRRMLFLARDRFGIKPLVYTKLKDKFLFASEVKGIFQDDEIPREIDEQTLYEEYIFGYPLKDATLFDGIKQLLPGHILTITKNEQTYKKYWETKIKPKRYVSEGYVAKNILKLLEKSIRRQMLSDVPVGILLSGGLDSSSIAAIMSKISDKSIKTFTISDNDDDIDIKHAKIVAEHLGTEHHEFVVSTTELIKELQNYVLHFEDIDLGFIYMFLLSEKTRKYVKVALCAQGADELFAGYERYKFVDHQRDDHIINSWSDIKNKNIRCAEYLKKVILNLLKPNKLDYLLVHDLTSQLTNYQLKVVDRNSMAFGLEVRVPYLDTELAHFATSIPSHLKLNGGIEKYILRKAVSDLNMPKKITNRKKHGSGTATTPNFVNEIKEISSKLIGEEYLKKHPYKKFFREPSQILYFDLLHKIFIDNQCIIPKNFTFYDLY